MALKPLRCKVAVVESPAVLRYPVGGFSMPVVLMLRKSEEHLTLQMSHNREKFKRSH